MRTISSIQVRCFLGSEPNGTGEKVDILEIANNDQFDLGDNRNEEDVIFFISSRMTPGVLCWVCGWISGGKKPKRQRELNEKQILYSVFIYLWCSGICGGGTFRVENQAP